MKTLRGSLAMGAMGLGLALALLTPALAQKKGAIS